VWWSSCTAGLGWVWGDTAPSGGVGEVRRCAIVRTTVEVAYAQRLYLCERVRWNRIPKM
jgi:hypothetical protein